MKKRRALSGYLILGTVIVIVLIVGSGLYVGATWGEVHAGYAAVVVNTNGNGGGGSVVGVVIGPVNKPFVKGPFYNELHTIRIAVDNVYMWSKFDQNDIETTHGDWEAARAQTRDKVNLDVDINVFWTVDPTPQKLIDLYLKFPLGDYKDRVIVPAIRETIRDVIVNETFDQVFENRAQLPTLVGDIVATKIANNADLQGAVVIDKSTVNILEIHMPYAIQQAQSLKKQSEIAIQTAANRRLATIINASAAQNATIINAKGFALARIIEANATKQSIQLILDAVCGGNKTCDAKTGDLYVQLIQLKEIAQANPNIIFFIGMGQNGSPVIYQIPSQKPGKP